MNYVDFSKETREFYEIFSASGFFAESVSFKGQYNLKKKRKHFWRVGIWK